MRFICENPLGGSANIVTWVILAVLLIAMLVFPYFTQRKKNQQYMDMLSAIKVGDLVKTAGGIIGKVTKISDKGDIKTIILETGSKTEKSYMEFDITSVYCVLKSTKVNDDGDEQKNAKNDKKTEKNGAEATNTDEISAEKVDETKKDETAEIEVKKPKQTKKTTQKTKSKK